MTVRLTALAVAWIGLWGGAALAAVAFDAVAAGDATETDAILWTRATDAGGPAKVTARVATDPDFRTVVWAGEATTAADNDFTLKLNPTGLAAGTRYFYRFEADAVSETGRFSTAPAANGNATVTFGLSGDADGRFRPFPSIAAIGQRDLDFFVFNGDTMYETASGAPATVSPAVPPLTAAATPEEARQALAAYNRKYRENIQGVAEDGAAFPGGQRGLVPLLRATGTYTLLDNHELGNAGLQAGGAPLALRTPRNPATTPEFDANATGTFHNRTLPFLTLEKAFYDYHPTRVGVAGTPEAGLAHTGPVVEAPDDPRSHGTPRNFFAQRWGRHVLYLQLDDRTYRDARLGTDKGAELSAADPRTAHPNRTILGATQFAWLRRTLLQAKSEGVTWIFVAISSPIDTVGGIPRGQRQDQKSWYGGYRAERNALLKFLADNKIGHVVFLATDDHMLRATRLQYDRGDGTKALVPDVFQLVAGPIGAEGPDMFPAHDRASVLDAITPRIESQMAMGQPPDGLAGLPGLTNVTRDFDPEADGRREPLDFLSPDTFNYAVLSVDEAGVLTVSVYGIASYLPNRNFTAPPEKEHLILSFQVKP